MLHFCLIKLYIKKHKSQIYKKENSKWLTILETHTIMCGKIQSQ